MQLWIDYRAHKQLPPLVERFDSFVIMDDELFEEFEEFKDNERITNGFSFVEINELIGYWIW